MSFPRISVVMPVYNGERYLRQAMESIFAQTFQDFEVLVIDDGSKDRTLEVLGEFRDPRLKVLKNEQNLGLSATLNRGLKEARGEWIARMDADDICVPVRFEKQVRFFETHPEVGVIGSAVIEIDDAGNQIRKRFYPDDFELIRWLALFESPIAHPTVMMRRSWIDRLGGYDSRLIYAEDHDLWIRASELGPISNMLEPLLYYRRHSLGSSKADSKIMSAAGVQVSTAGWERLLGREVEPSAVQCFLAKHWDSQERKIRSLKDLEDLYRHFVAAYSPSVDSLKLIRADFSYRVFACLGKDLTKPVFGHWVRLALTLDPAVLKRLPMAWWDRHVPDFGYRLRMRLSHSFGNVHRVFSGLLRSKGIPKA